MSRPVALVTGGSQGIGRAIVEGLLADGWTVAFTYRTDNDAARQIENGAQGSARGFVLDLTDPARPDQLVREVAATFGPVEGLVNNAGVRHDSLLAMTPDSEWDMVVGINQTGAFRCCRAVLPGMIHLRRGAIVNVSSLGAVLGVPGQTAYAASKAALLGLTRALAREMGKRQIRVNAVLPGYVPTAMTGDLSETAVRSLRAHECLPSGTSPADVANLVVFLLSSRAAAITGQAIAVDAGSSA
jgi:3-oxoacyl-[acyl-carrier protein] reductase